MYRCRKCSAEFEEPLDGGCPACGYPVRGQRVYSTDPRPSSSYQTTPPPASPTPQRRSGRANPAAVGLIAIVLLAVIGLAVAFLFNGFGDVFEDSDSGEVYIPEQAEPIWSDRGTEMTEAGYEAIDGIEPDLWPIADNTLWFGYPEGQQLLYNVFREDRSYGIELGAGLTAIGDIHPLADGSGVLTVLQYEGDGSGVYSVDLDGNLTKLVGEDLVWNLLIDDGIPPHELDRAARINDVFVSPRISPSGGMLYVGAGGSTERRIIIVNLETGEASRLTTYRDNSVPRLVEKDYLILEYRYSDSSALIYKHNLTTHEEENIMCPGITDSFVIDKSRMIAYNATDYEGNPVIHYMLPGETYTEKFYLPEGRGGAVSIGPGGVIVTSGRENGKTSFFFLNPNNADLRYARTYDMIPEFVSGILGPNIRTEQPQPSGKDK